MSESAPAMTPDVALCAGIVQQTPEAVIFADRDGVIRIWNGGAEALFGYTASEAQGASLDLIIPERLRAAHWAGYRRAIATGRTQHGGQIRTTRAVHRDGSKLYVDMSFGLVVAPDGGALGSMAIARDASAKRALEQALAECRAAREKACGAA